MPFHQLKTFAECANLHLIQLLVGIGKKYFLIISDYQKNVQS